MPLFLQTKWRFYQALFPTVADPVVMRAWVRVTAIDDFVIVGSRGAVVSAALSERKVAGSIPTIGDFHTVGPCKKAVFACLATDVK